VTATTLPPPPPPPAGDPDPPTAPRPVEGHLGLLDRWSDPILLLVGAGLLAVLGLLPWAAKGLVTLPLALLLPGHAVLAAADRPERALGTGGRIALRVVLSMAVVALTVLAVGSVVGVSRASVVAGVWAVTSIAALASWNREVPTRAETPGPHWTQSGVVLALTALVAFVVVVGALVLLPDPLDTPYSRLSVTGTSKVSGSPIVVDRGTTASVRVQVENGTGATRSYRVIPAIDGGALWKAPKVRLQPGERWTGTIEGKIPADACVSRLTVALASDGEPAGVAPLVLYIRNEAGDACG
jgi:hypothetical protein